MLEEIGVLSTHPHGRFSARLLGKGVRPFRNVGDWDEERVIVVFVVGGGGVPANCALEGAQNVSGAPRNSLRDFEFLFHVCGEEDFCELYVR